MLATLGKMLEKKEDPYLLNLYFKSTVCISKEHKVQWEKLQAKFQPKLKIETIKIIILEKRDF